jgi:hypothetical protein
MAFNFNAGNDTELHCDSTPITEPPFTVSLWLRATTFGNYKGAFTFYDWHDVYYFYLGSGSSAAPDDLAVYSSSSAGEGLRAKAEDSIPDGTWVHAAATFAADGTIYAWADGVKGSAGSDTGNHGFDYIYVSDSRYDEEWYGDLCEIGVWNRVLDDEEIKQLARGYAPIFVNRGLVCYWPLLNEYKRDLVGNYNLYSNGENEPTVAAHHRIIYPRPHQILWKGAGAGQFYKSLAGGIGFSGALKKQISISPAGVLSFDGAVKKGMFEELAGGVSFAGGLDQTLVLTKAVDGVISFGGSLAVRAGKLLGGVLSFTGSVAKQMSFLKSLSGLLSFTGTLTKYTTVGFAGVLSFTGQVGKAVTLLKTISGAVGFSGGVSTVLNPEEEENKSRSRYKKQLAALFDHDGEDKWE